MEILHCLVHKDTFNTFDDGVLYTMSPPHMYIYIYYICISPRKKIKRKPITMNEVVTTCSNTLKLHSLKLTWPLKMDGWKTFSFPIGFRPIFRCYSTWMSQEVSKWLVSGLYPQYTPFIRGL